MAGPPRTEFSFSERPPAPTPTNPKGNKMTVVEQLKKEAMKLRKARNPLAASITFAISEIEKVGKNDGNRETTNDEAIKVVQKLLTTVHANIETVKGIDDGRSIAFKHEEVILSSVLPKMATEEDIKVFLVFTFLNEKPTKKDVMAALKKKFGATVDMKLASQLAMQVLGV